MRRRVRLLSQESRHHIRIIGGLQNNRDEKRVVAESKNSRDRIITTVSVDDWIFNFGPNQFPYQLHFENGRVARIDSLNYGY